jgi:hypothetical protein
MKKPVLIVPAVAALLALPALASSADSWLHVKVQEKGAKASTVRVNLPLSVIEKAAPLAGNEWQKHAKIEAGDHGMSKDQLKAMWAAVRDSEDAEFVRVEGTDENVHVAKMKGKLVIHVDDKGSKNEKVAIELPMEVADALLSGPGNQLDFAAAIEALKHHGNGQFVSVNDDDSTVRIWIDGHNGTE